jgi:hypothetical protein
MHLPSRYASDLPNYGFASDPRWAVGCLARAVAPFECGLWGKCPRGSRVRAPDHRIRDALIGWCPDVAVWIVKVMGSQDGTWGGPSY